MKDELGTYLVVNMKHGTNHHCQPGAFLDVKLAYEDYILRGLTRPIVVRTMEGAELYFSPEVIGEFFVSTAETRAGGIAWSEALSSRYERGEWE